jgi:hypothetical protein
MLSLLLAQAQAQAAQATDSGMNSYLAIGIVVVGLGSLSSLAVSLITLSRFSSGKANERQIEPTQLAALQTQIRENHTQNQAELKAQTSTLGDIKGELGIVNAKVGAVEKSVDALSDVKGEVGIVRSKVDSVAKDLDGAHQRIGGISRELAGTTARVDGLEKREGKK